ncbi:glucose-6-phosphate 1-epimerase [Oryzomicrobium terrae]|uniref:Putative glucose-6-phosphate 1-epimerase n=1 Tax=Oryzomicrobium terrae TaxID=1735038 RepID=A0A5C1EC85_9RHOO|nr:D-hexose-6-phosphate mutarotase [Oryzomicrobium terrae]QEL66265.1 glucose-6-phosphate 1-epimerase [Oryzomicrobium terrae]
MTPLPSVTPCDFHGTPALRLTTGDGASAVVSLLGGQLLSWVPPGEKEQLFVSERAVFDGSKPIRGGVPVCFPQFADLGGLPKHGLLRTRRWEVSDQSQHNGCTLVSLVCGDDAASRTLWPHAFRAELTVAIEGERLDLELSLTNPGEAPFAFTGALHTYLKVAEVEEVSLEGLYGLDYLDKLKDAAPTRETAPSLVVEREVDRIYYDCARPLLLRDEQHTLGINTEGFSDVVVWNPWEGAEARFPDLAAKDFRRFLCVEAAVARQPVTVAPGEEWWGRQTVVVLS